MIRHFIAFIFVISLFGGCKKSYPDDNWPHLRCPEKRLIKGRSWNFHDYEFLVPISYEFGPNLDENSISFNKDGTCQQKAISLSLPSEMIYLYDFRGTWELIENDSKIKIISAKNSSIIKIWTIQQLDRKYLTIYCDSIKYSFN